MKRFYSVISLILLSVIGVHAVWADVPVYDVQIQTKTSSVSDSTVTDSVIWTPATDHSIALLGCVLSSDNNNTIQVESSDTDVIPPQHLESYGMRTISGGNFPIWVGAEDATLSWTTEDATDASILCWGFEFLQ